MSGGIAYVYDKDGSFKDKCNMSMVELERPDADDELTINKLLVNHLRYTKSPVAKRILDNFYKEKKRFVKVMPLEYKRILETKVVEEKLDLVEVSDG